MSGVSHASRYPAHMTTQETVTARVDLELRKRGMTRAQLAHVAYFGPWRVDELLEYREEEDGRVAVVRLFNGSTVEALAADIFVLPGGAA